MSERSLVSERVGQCFWETDRGRDRLEFTEYGAGDAWVVLVPPLLVPRRIHARLARSLAQAGLHVVALDPLGHGRSDRPADPLAYSTTAFAEQVVALLDQLGAAQAVVGGAALGANVALEVAASAPERVRGLVLQMPVLDNALEPGLATAGPLLFAARFAPLTVTGARLVTRPIPRRWLPGWADLARDVLDQRPGPMAAVLHGVCFGPLAPAPAARRAIQAPALVIGHPGDPLHPLADAEMVADELPNATLERAESMREWWVRPERLDLATTRFVLDCRRRRARRRRA